MGPLCITESVLDYPGGQKEAERERVVIKQKAIDDESISDTRIHAYVMFQFEGRGQVLKKMFG